MKQVWLNKHSVLQGTSEPTEVDATKIFPWSSKEDRVMCIGTGATVKMKGGL